MIFRSPHPDVSIPAQSITEFVLGSPRARPEDAALVDASTGRVLTYGEQREWVRRVACGLAVIGIGKADVVALCLPNSPEFAIVFHAVVAR
jgi:acyl-coenzyme A synthetase/AMP-(fatty) acid ligase